jgi:eukaryotic-like serine/threonine-protein kinase
MQNRKSQPDPQDRANSATKPGVSVPAKGDSSGSHFPVDPDATLVDFPQASSDPEATFVDADATVVDVDATLVDVGVPGRSPAPRSGPRASRLQVSAPILQTNDVLGGRYEILQLLGEGGMGAVYKARDRELDRFVALKLIRPELAANPSILARFKQELLLSREVTHKNVIRIYDLGDADGVKFITMEFVEGQDLRSLIQEKKKFPPEEAVELMQQVCRALEAAHTLGIIHRDLKPQNIMRDQTGRILVMDFGLARMVEGDGMTQTGALVGTMEYMSPEQALGKDLDQRSDLFSMGLILYELLTGVMPFKAESAVASLIKRNQERASPVSDHDGTIPGALSNIVSKCLERDPNLRYQTATEFLRDLDAWQGKSAAATLRFPTSEKPWGQTVPWHWIGGIAAVLVLAIAGFLLRGKLSGPGPTAPTAPAVSLAILPFRNASGDPSFDWLGPSLADMLSTDVGQSAHLRTIAPDRLHQVLSDLRITPGTSIDSTMVGHIAEFSNADTLVWGQYAKFGGQIRIDATLQDLKHDRSVPIKIEAVDEKDIPGAVDRLAASIRNNLAFSSDVVKELQASSFQPSSKSVPALRDFSQGGQLLRDGKYLDAVKMFQAATQEDPQFALAYSRLAEADSALGYDNDAEQASRKAVELSQQLPVAEKYLIQATHAQVMKDNKKAIEAYELLAKSMPDNSDVESALGSLYTETGDYVRARAQLSRLLVSDPKSVKALWQMGVVEFMSGNPQAALDPLNKGLSLAVQMDAQELKALILQSLGISYRLINKPDDAMRSYQDAMAINRRLGLKRALASNLVEMAVVQNNQGKVDAALSDYKQALQIQREIGMKKEVGDTLINVGVVYQSKGDYDKALENYKESLTIQRDTGDENYQALCLSNIGGVYLGKGDTDNALTYLQQALQLREKLNLPAAIAETLTTLGQAYSSTGQYDQALATSMRALDLWRKTGNARGAAYESHDIGLVFQYQGRFGAAVNAMQEAVNGYRAAGDRSEDMVELLNDLADALAQAGRASESDALLREAQTIVHDLKNENAQAELLSTQGDIKRFSGDSKSAAAFYQQALRAASHGTDPDEILLCRLHVAEIALTSGSSDSAIRDLRKLMEQADSRDLKYVSLETSIDVAEAMIDRKGYAQAEQELQTDLGKSEKLGSHYQTARVHYLLANALRLGGNGSEASEHYRTAISSIEDMRKDAGAEKLLERADLKSMFADASKFSTVKN